MDINSRLYTAAGHCYEAAKALQAAHEEDKRMQLLDMADELLASIKIDESELQRIGEYEDKIKDKLRESILN